jgi:hypothetical protein
LSLYYPDLVSLTPGVSSRRHDWDLMTGSVSRVGCWPLSGAVVREEPTLARCWV